MKRLLIFLVIAGLTSPCWAQQYRTYRPRQSFQNGAVNGHPYTVQRDQWGNTYTHSQGNPVVVIPRTRPGQTFQGSANGKAYWGQTDRWGNTQVYEPNKH